VIPASNTPSPRDQPAGPGSIGRDDDVVLFNCASGLKYEMPEAGIPLDRTKPVDYAAL